MLATIIITNYNYGKYIGACIRSCLNQTLHSDLYEVIVVDDCSKDHSLKVINEYLGNYNNLKLIKNKKNIGVAASSNKAIKQAKGKYVIRVDADDYINIETLRILTYFLSKNPEYFCVACDYFLVTQNEIKIAKVSARDNPISCGKMYRTKILKSLGAYNPEFRHREEEELRHRILKNKNLKNFYLNFPLYRYRMHGSNKTKNKDYIKKFKKKILKLNNYLSEFNKLEKKLIKNIVAVIPARGGSKRLPRKNMYKIWGKPMMYWPVLAAKKSKYIKSIYVTSDDKKILNYSKKLNLKSIYRPKNIAGDKTFKMVAIRHAVQEISKKNKPTLVVSLQANSPDIETREIDKAIEKLITYNLNEIISVDENYNQNGALRVMQYKASLQKELSTHCGFIITNTSDIHTLSDINNLKMKKFKNENK